MPCDHKFSVSLLHGAFGRSAFCDRGINTGHTHLLFNNIWLFKLYSSKQSYMSTINEGQMRYYSSYSKNCHIFLNKIS